MNRFLLAVFLLLPLFNYAQTAPTLDSSDIVFASQYLKYHSASNSIGVSHAGTGANHTWDYHTLKSASLYLDTFTAINKAPFTYSLFFFLSSNITYPDKNPTSIAGTALSNVWNFYRKSNTKFQQPGFAGSVSGIPSPIMYSSPDVLYRFPMNFGNVDSCAYSYTLGGAGLGFGITESRKRVNTVDGWGTLYTPYDTFTNVLRLHSKMNIKDSIALDSVNINFNVINSIQHEYKFLAKGQDWPVLTIRTTEFFGFETTTGVYYRDTVHHHTKGTLNNGLADFNSNANWKLFPNPVSDCLQLQTSEIIVSATITNLMGQVLAECYLSSSNGLFKINTSQLASGHYLITFTNSVGKTNSQLFTKE